MVHNWRLNVLISSTASCKGGNECNVSHCMEAAQQQGAQQVRCRLWLQTWYSWAQLCMVMALRWALSSRRDTAHCRCPLSRDQGRRLDGGSQSRMAYRKASRREWGSLGLRAEIVRPCVDMNLCHPHGAAVSEEKASILCFFSILSVMHSLLSWLICFESYKPLRESWWATRSEILFSVRLAFPCEPHVLIHLSHKCSSFTLVAFRISIDILEINLLFYKAGATHCLFMMIVY